MKYLPSGDKERKGIRIEQACPVVDLGVPSEGHGIYALAIDRPRGMIYGLTYPDGEFFRCEIQPGRVAIHLITAEKFEHEKAIGRALALDQEGNVFTAARAEDSTGSVSRPGNSSAWRSGCRLYLGARLTTGLMPGLLMRIATSTEAPRTATFSA